MNSIVNNKYIGKNLDIVDRRNTDRLARSGVTLEITDEEEYTIIADPWEGTKVMQKDSSIDCGGQSYSPDQGQLYDYLSCSINSDQFIGLFILWKTRHPNIDITSIEATATDKVVIRFNKG
jgi:hypothetical protein